MSFSRFAIGFSRHRKVSRLSDAAFRLWASAIDYAREQLTAGEIDKSDLEILPKKPAGKKLDEAIAELVSIGLWDELDPESWLIHDFDDWQDTPDQVKQKRADARERMKRVRESRSLDVRANTERTSPEVTLTDPPLLSSSLDLRSHPFQLSSEGSDRSRARAAQKPARSEHIPEEITQDWLPAASQLTALAAKYAVSEARVLAQVAEFIWYWSAGGGARKRKTARGWAQAFGNSVEAAAKRGGLYLAGLLSAPPATAAADSGRLALAKGAEARAEAERDRRRAEAKTAATRRPSEPPSTGTGQT